MSDLVVFYSLTGKSREVAERLAERLRADIAEIVEVRPRGLAAKGMIQCLLDSLLRRRPAIQPTTRSAAGYDRVYLAAPVWAGRLAGPARSWLATEGKRTKSLALVLQLGGGPHEAVFREIEAATGRRPDPVLEVYEKDFAEKKAMDKVAAFAAARTGTPAVRAL